ncbi:UPF0223 family protein [Liquorilactobacillus oeni]|uniref:Uncharacterized protein n=1 Tax=Liquorilactobacillus oeni DSM 19972 TaxID=1423777 RepID=A0A0R1MH65_9LACO|nr:UPF0223 family protein [Liquorilactobacillus oeni]KRL04645.1 hypothetical protein FD46_GL001779 [Liquorilactobacillus oeni DSM 19972]
MNIPESYSYPLRDEWSTAEIVTVIDFYQAVEKSYTSKILRSVFLKKYQDYLKAVPMKMTQKQLDREFQQNTQMSIYQAVKTARKTEQKYLHVPLKNADEY